MSVKFITLASDPELCPPNSWLSPSSPQLSRPPLRLKNILPLSNSFAILKSPRFPFLKSQFSFERAIFPNCRKLMLGKALDFNGFRKLLRVPRQRAARLASVHRVDGRTHKSVDEYAGRRIGGNLVGDPALCEARPVRKGKMTLFLRLDPLS